MNPPLKSAILFAIFSASLSTEAQAPFAFINHQHMVILPFTTWDHHIYVKARVNDSGDQDFLFDPSAGSTEVLVDPSVAQTTHFPMTDSIVLWLKTLKVPRQRVTWASHKDLEAREKHDIGGVLGYTFIRNFVIRFDARHGRLILTDPAYFMDNTLHGKVPLREVDLSLLLREGKTVTFNYPHRYMIISE
jgi:hypothetical protein